MPEADWLALHQKDNLNVQELRQHHIHLPSASDPSVRVPLAHCHRTDRPGECRGDYRRDSQLARRAVIICPGLARRYGLKTAGKRNRLGILHGRRTNGWLNASHPATTTALRCNNNAQLPYRVPICAASRAPRGTA